MNKKSPQRMCIICRNMFDKKQLLRIVKSKDGQFAVDLTGKLNGRGAYVCKNSDCLEKIKKGKLLNKAFKCQVPDEIYDEASKYAQ